MLYSDYDAIVVGGGFYGCFLAQDLARRLGRVLILEREADLLTRASYTNQARVHNGYHYPRSILTATRSAANYPRFTKEFRECMDRSFLHLYGIARANSKVTAYQFQKFCQQAGIPLREAPASVKSLFNPDMVSDLFAVEECAFNADKLRAVVTEKLRAKGVETACNHAVERISRGNSRSLCVTLEDGRRVEASLVFNCAYSGINRLLAQSSLPTLALKHELAELALIAMPRQLENIGVTLMDGPYFSAFPFPPRGLHTLSHVTYTPQSAWTREELAPPAVRRPSSKSVFMLKDAQRYLPALKDARYVESMFETKTVLVGNEADDGRPILWSRHHGLRGLFVILGSKIDNIYDIMQAMESEDFTEESNLLALEATR
jgi:glycine/D-amino acid oxidase-like deaminating enzyme